ncbi:MAG: hypothetical protein Q4G68_00040 [Planctomycetia bacterium]|nr:hypothetical protein [Planctomycetia bacterium]
MFYELTKTSRPSRFFGGVICVITLLIASGLLADSLECPQPESSETKTEASHSQVGQVANVRDPDNASIDTKLDEEIPCLGNSGVVEVLSVLNGDISVEEASKMVLQRKEQDRKLIEQYIDQDIAFSLSFAVSDTNDEDIKKLAGATKIVSLDLWNCSQVTDKSLPQIAKLKSLTSLNLEGTSITKQGLLTLNLPNLRKLNLSRQGRYYDEDMVFFTKMPLLEELILTKASLTDKGVSNLATLKHLKFLAVGDRPKIKGKCMKDIAGIQSLELLGLEGCCHLKDAAFAELVSMPHLKVLCLNWTQVGEEAFTHFGRFHALEQLNVDSPNITDSCLKSLKSSSRLRVLHLQGGKISDNGLAELTSLPALRTLCITNYSDISDEGIQCLAKIPSIHSILFDSCENITESGISQLQQKIPDCEVRAIKTYWRDAKKEERVMSSFFVVLAIIVTIPGMIIYLVGWKVTNYLRRKRLDSCSCVSQRVEKTAGEKENGKE